MSEIQIHLKYFWFYCNCLSFCTLWNSRYWRMTTVLCGFEEFLGSVFMFIKNLVFSPAFRMWHAVSCMLWPSQIVHPWPFCLSVGMLPPPIADVLEELSCCTCTPTSAPGQGLVSGHSLGILEEEKARMVKIKGNLSLLHSKSLGPGSFV